jgi:hypothetical protein
MEAESAPTTSGLRAWWRRRGRWKWWLIAVVVILFILVPLRGHTKHARRSATYAVACRASGPCVAVGWYKDNSDNYQAMVMTELRGEWSTGREITLPPNAAHKQSAYLGSVACPASQSCVAVGEYLDRSGKEQTMVVSEREGLWGRATEITLPPDAATR